MGEQQLSKPRLARFLKLLINVLSILHSASYILSGWLCAKIHCLQIPLLGSQSPSSLPLFQSGEIFQEFTADGQVKNIIQASVPYLLEQGKACSPITLCSP